MVLPRMCKCGTLVVRFWTVYVDEAEGISAFSCCKPVKLQTAKVATAPTNSSNTQNSSLLIAYLSPLHSPVYLP